MLSAFIQKHKKRIEKTKVFRLKFIKAGVHEFEHVGLNFPMFKLQWVNVIQIESGPGAAADDQRSSGWSSNPGVGFRLIVRSALHHCGLCNHHYWPRLQLR